MLSGFPLTIIAPLLFLFSKGLLRKSCEYLFGAHVHWVLEQQLSCGHCLSAQVVQSEGLLGFLSQTFLSFFVYLFIYLFIATYNLSLDA